MAAVNQVIVVEVAPDDSTSSKRSSRLKKIRERAGARVRYYQSVAGGYSAVLVVAETAGWKPRRVHG